MDTYSPDQLYAGVVDELFLSRTKAQAVGGTNNIRAKGDGPEQAVRKLIGSLIGGQYRVTHGHVVRADGLKSKQIDIIIVRDVPAATMHRTEAEEVELVRVEWVAAVGEVKGSWAKHDEVIESYCQMVRELEDLQKRCLIENTMRFGTITDSGSVSDLTQPITGRQWKNRCHSFLIALAQGECKVKHLEDDVRRTQIRPCDASMLIIDQQHGGTLCMPGRSCPDGIELGVRAEMSASNTEEADAIMWLTIQAEVDNPRTSSARLLHYFITDLQLHLGIWDNDSYLDPRHYAKVGRILKHRHAKERR